VKRGNALSILHVVDMAFLLVAFLLRIIFFWAIERKQKRGSKERLPIQVLVTFAFMVLVAIPGNGRADIAIYAVASLLMFTAFLKWGSTLQDFYTYRKAGITESDRLRAMHLAHDLFQKKAPSKPSFPLADTINPAEVLEK
jgi:hypothetical protein